MLRRADILDFHAASILAQLRPRSDLDHDLGAAVEHVHMRSMAPLASGVDPDLEFAESSLRHASS